MSSRNRPTQSGAKNPPPIPASPTPATAPIPVLPLPAFPVVFPVTTTIFSCPAEGCTEWYFSSRSLSLHFSVYHHRPLDYQWRCCATPCQLQFLTPKQARKHLYTAHGVALPKILDIPPDSCPDEGFTCTTISIPHLASRFQCPISEGCVKNFGDVDNLRRHLLITHKVYARLVWRCSTYSCPVVNLEKLATKNHFEKECTRLGKGPFPRAKKLSPHCQACNVVLGHKTAYCNHHQEPGLLDAITSGTYYEENSTDLLLQVRNAIEKMGWEFVDIWYYLQTIRYWKDPSILFDALLLLKQRAESFNTSIPFIPTSTNSNTASVSAGPVSTGVKNKKKRTPPAPITNEDDEYIIMDEMDVQPIILDMTTSQPNAPIITTLTQDYAEGQTLEEILDQEDDDAKSVYYDADEKPAPAPIMQGKRSTNRRSSPLPDLQRIKQRMDTLMNKVPVHLPPNAAKDAKTRKAALSAVNRLSKTFSKINQESPNNNSNSTMSLPPPIQESPAATFAKAGFTTAGKTAPFKAKSLEEFITSTPAKSFEYYKKSTNPTLATTNEGNNSRTGIEVSENMEFIDTMESQDMETAPGSSYQLPFIPPYSTNENMDTPPPFKYQLRVPFFKNKEERAECEARVQELCQKYLTLPNDTWYNFEAKCYYMSEELWHLIQYQTRPKRKPMDNEHNNNSNNMEGGQYGRRRNVDQLPEQDDDADITAELRRPGLLNSERRHLLRKRRTHRIGQESAHIVKRYRHRPKDTFESIITPRERVNFEIPMSEVEKYFEEKYSQEIPGLQEQSTNQQSEENNVENTTPKIQLRPITQRDVNNRLGNLKNNTSAGPDGISYDIWKLFPCLSEWMYNAFVYCQRNCRVPTLWKCSRTILFPKKGDMLKCENWRPISLQNTIAKIYTGVLEMLLRECINNHGILSPNQKGFMNTPGTIEHDYYVHAKIRQARRKGQSLYVCSYDFKDAYGSLNHSHIRNTLEQLGFEENTIGMLLSSVEKAPFFIGMNRQQSRCIQQNRGVKQGDPLSPLLFNLCIEPLSRRLSAIQQRQQDDSAYNHLMFADDLITICSTPMECRLLHHEIQQFCKQVNININMEKCKLMASLPKGTAEIRHRRRRLDKRFYLDFENGGNNDETSRLYPIGPDESFAYLGNQVGIHRGGIYGHFKELLSNTKQQLRKLSNSNLRIYQKHHAIKTFIIPTWEYFIRLNGLGPHNASLLAKALRTAVARYVGIPFSTTISFFHCHQNDGGLGIPEPWNWACCTQLVHVLGLLNSHDEKIKRLVTEEILTLIKLRYDMAPPENIEEIPGFLIGFMNGEYEGSKRAKYRDCFDPIAQIPRASQHIGVRVIFDGNNGIYSLDELERVPSIFTGPKPKNSRARNSMTPLQQIKKHCQDKLFQRWNDLKSQGQATTKQSNQFSNAWLSNDELHPRQYKFTVRSRLHLLPTNYNLTKWKKATNPNCPHCPNTKESTHHLLSNCPRYRQQRTERHDKVLELLLRAARYNFPSCKIFTNETSPTVNYEQLRPDIVIEDERTKMVYILDLTITAQSQEDGFNVAKQRKLDRYAAIKNKYEQLGWKAELDAIVFGDLGGTDDANHQIINILCGGRGCSTPSSYGFRLHRRIITTILRNNYSIWVERCKGRRSR